MNKKIIESYYYIIKVVCDNGRRTYYKIGETNTKNRPIKLVEKYTALRKNEAEILAFETLPHNDVKRLNDKTIHSNIDSSILESVDPMIIKGCLDEVDGITEFFNLKDSSVNIVEYIKNLVASIKKSQYTANVYYDTELEYSKDQYHLVDSDIVAKIIDTYPNVTDKLYNDIQNNILLVGQFEPEFIASIAMFHNITLWHDSAEQKHEYKFERINNNITYIDTLGELLMSDKDFDIIISNPPYGKVGAEITQNIIDNINYKEFINLMPANDYTRAKDLFKYVDINSMRSIRDGFKDAAVTTHMALINKKSSNITKEEFEIENYTDDSLKKYFYENVNRKHYAIDAVPGTGLTIKNAGIWDINKTFILHNRDMNHTYMSGNSSITYKWNIEKSITFNDIVNRKEHSDNTQLTFCNINFNTQVERDNFTRFIYSNPEFIKKLWTALNLDMGIKSIGLPKVDWSREWTVEEILTDYGYSEAEIKEVMDDLVNFKGMD